MVKLISTLVRFLAGKSKNTFRRSWFLHSLFLMWGVWRLGTWQDQDPQNWKYFLLRRRRSHTGCKQLETWNPQFTKWLRLFSRTNWFLNSQYLLTTQIKPVTRYMGTVHLPSLEAIASCGYNSVWDRDARTYFPITRSEQRKCNGSRLLLGSLINLYPKKYSLIVS